MAGQIEEPLRFNFQADLLHSGSISFGRFESESLSWERRSSFSHNRYLEEVEKYSKPGSVTEKKAYFEAHFRRKALLKQSSSESQDGREVTTSENDDMHDLQESENGNESKHFASFAESPHSSGHFSYDKETEIQIRVNQNVETFYAENTNLSSVDHPMIGQDHVKLEETHVIGTETVDLVKSEEITEVTRDDSVVMVDVASETKQPKPKLKARANFGQVSRTVSSEASKVSAKTKIREIKTLPMKEKVKKSPRPATSSIAHSGRRTLKPEESSTSFPKAKLPPSNRSIVKEYRPEKSLPGARETVNRTKQNNHAPSKPHANHIVGGFTFKSDQRAEKRKEEKKAAAEISKSLNSTPMPSFYKESARSLDQNKAISSNNKTPNRPRTASMAPSTKRVPSNSASSSMAPRTKIVPSNSANSSIPRPGSSTSVTSRYRRPEPGQLKKKDLNLQKQKGHEAIIGARVRETKRVHTGAGLKPGYLAVRVAT